jgi:polygalacturonase
MMKTFAKLIAISAMALLCSCTIEKSITDFGGKGDGLTLNSEAFAKGIEEIYSKGGGILKVPAGIWLTGPITLKSGVNLHLERNALVVFSSDLEHYPIVETNFEGLDVRRCLALINADGARNISITGEGVFDGNGQDWRAVKKSKVPSSVWKAHLAKGGVLSPDGKTWFPDEGYAKAQATAGNFNKADDSFDEQEIKRFLRPELLLFKNCENVLLEGCTFQNSPAWNLHLLWSKNIEVKGVTVLNPAWSQNGDGIDIDACDGVYLHDSHFDVGDDAICIKSGKDEDGRRHGRACSNLLIENCTVYAGHGGFVIGSEMSGGVHDVSVKNCTFIGTDVGLRFKSLRGRGGVVRNINIENIYMKDIIGDAIIFNLFYAGKPATEADKDGNAEAIPQVDETTPEFRDINISNIICNGAKSAVYVNGLPEMPVSNLSIKDCIFRAKKGIETHNVQNFKQDNVQFIQQ